MSIWFGTIARHEVDFSLLPGTRGFISSQRLLLAILREGSHANFQDNDFPYRIFPPAYFRAFLPCRSRYSGCAQSRLRFPPFLPSTAYYRSLAITPASPPTIRFATSWGWIILPISSGTICKISFTAIFWHRQRYRAASVAGSASCIPRDARTGDAGADYRLRDRRDRSVHMRPLCRFAADLRIQDPHPARQFGADFLARHTTIYWRCSTRSYGGAQAPAGWMISGSTPSSRAPALR